MCCIIFKKKCTYTTLTHIDNNTISPVMNNIPNKALPEINAKSNFVYMFLLVIVVMTSI